MSIEQRVAQLLFNSQKTLAIAESCTGGLLTNRLTNIPGSSRFLKWAIVAYSNAAKSKILKVPEKLVRRHGAASTQVAVSMAQQARRLQKTDLGIGITGIAGPSGGTKSKPVGRTFIAVSTPAETLCLECQFSGPRLSVKRQASTQALRLLYEFLQ